MILLLYLEIKTWYNTIIRNSFFNNSVKKAPLLGLFLYSAFIMYFTMTAGGWTVVDLP